MGLSERTQRAFAQDFDHWARKQEGISIPQSPDLSLREKLEKSTSNSDERKALIRGLNERDFLLDRLSKMEKGDSECEEIIKRAMELSASLGRAVNSQVDLRKVWVRCFNEAVRILGPNQRFIGRPGWVER